MHIKSALLKTLPLLMTVAAMAGATSAVKANAVLPDLPKASSDIVLTVDGVSSSKNLYQSLTADTTYSQTTGGAGALKWTPDVGPGIAEVKV